MLKDLLLVGLTMIECIVNNPVLLVLFLFSFIGAVFGIVKKKIAR